MKCHRIPGPDETEHVLLVGKDNPLSNDPRYALYHEPANCAGHRLQSMILGLEARRWYLPLWRTNLCIGDWSLADGARRAGELMSPLAPWSVIVALGKDVAEAFAQARGVEPRRAFARESFDRAGGRPPTGTLVFLPHPSGRNAASWTADAISRTRDILRTAAPGIPWGSL